MRNSLKKISLLLLSSAVFIGLTGESLAQNYYQNPHQAAPLRYAPQTIPGSPHLHRGPVNLQKPSQPRVYGGLMGRLKGQNRAQYNPQHIHKAGMPYAGPMAAPMRTSPMFQQWVDWEPEYLIQPGDQLDIVVSSAPELSRTLTVGPDGRVVMPMSQPVMAAGRSFVQLQNLLQAELSKQLRDPRVAVTPRAYAPEQIFVGGEVGQPGTFTIPNKIGVIEAVFMAGGLRPTARTSKVAVLRRAPSGRMMMRTVDFKNGLKNIGQYNDDIQLRRGDIVFVPQSTLAEVGTFVQNFRNALPVDFTVSYQLGNFGGNGDNGGVVAPIITP